jgi:hypothetical protein
MKKQINEARFQFLAGVITESEFRQLSENATPKFKVGDMVNLQQASDDGSAFTISAIAPNYESIPEGEIEDMEGFDMDAYDEMELNSPWYKNPSGEYEGWYCEVELEPAGLNENESLPTIQSISKTDLPIMVGKGKTLQVKLSNGKTHFVSPGDLEGIYGGDSDDLDYFVGQEWDQ